MKNEQPPRPKNQHYLPRKAYLSLFVVSNQPGQIYVYERNRQPQLSSINKFGRVKHLYSIDDRSGKRIYAIEDLLRRLEENAAPVLARLSSAPGRTSLSQEEAAHLRL